MKEGWKRATVVPGGFLLCFCIFSKSRDHQLNRGRLFAGLFVPFIHAPTLKEIKIIVYIVINN